MEDLSHAFMVRAAHQLMLLSEESTQARSQIQLRKVPSKNALKRFTTVEIYVYRTEDSATATIYDFSTEQQARLILAYSSAYLQGKKTFDQFKRFCKRYG